MNDVELIVEAIESLERVIIVGDCLLLGAFTALCWYMRVDFKAVINSIDRLRRKLK